MGKFFEQQPLQQPLQTAETMVQQQQMGPQQLPHTDPQSQLATNKEVVKQLSQATQQMEFWLYCFVLLVSSSSTAGT